MLLRRHTEALAERDDAIDQLKQAIVTHDPALQSFRASATPPRSAQTPPQVRPAQKLPICSTPCMWHTTASAGSLCRMPEGMLPLAGPGAIHAVLYTHYAAAGSCLALNINAC